MGGWEGWRGVISNIDVVLLSTVIGYCSLSPQLSSLLFTAYRYLFWLQATGIDTGIYRVGTFIWVAVPNYLPVLFRFAMGTQ